MTDTKIIATSAAEGAFGFDCNTIVRPNDAAAFVAAGYKFAIRYVPRVGALPHDITSAELRMLLNAGLGVMLVQHVEFQRYWGALNLNADQFPATRGLCMKQHAAHGLFTPPKGVTLAIDVDTVHGDNLGGLPTLAAPFTTLPG
jgi:hypothetical protein